MEERKSRRVELRCGRCGRVVARCCTGDFTVDGVLGTYGSGLEHAEAVDAGDAAVRVTASCRRCKTKAGRPLTWTHRSDTLAEMVARAERAGLRSIELA